MSNCSQHKKEVAGISDMKQLAEMIGDLHYETLTELMRQLAFKISRDAGNDLNIGRNDLGVALVDTSLNILKVYRSVDRAWQISKPFMQ